MLQLFWLRFVVLSTVLLLIGVQTSRAEENWLLLVDGREAKVRVVAGSAPDDAAVATEFAAYVEKMTGVRLPILKEQERLELPAIYIGDTLPASRWTFDAEPARAGDGRYTIAPVEGGLAVRGAGEGTWFGMYDLLYVLGCRFYLPCAEGEYIPRLRTAALPLTRRDEVPAFAGRTLAFHGGEVLFAGPYDWNYEQWRRKVRLGGAYFSHGHAFESFITEKEYFAEHPEYFALARGERLPNQLCLTNPDVMEIFIAKTRAQFEGGARSVSLSANDAQEYCSCESCAAERGGSGDFTANLLGMANRVARALHNEFPDRFLCFYATYHGSGDLPPGMTVEPMVVPVLFPRAEGHRVDDPRCEKGQRFTAIAKDWRARGMAHHGIYDYLVQRTDQMVTYPIFHAMASAMRASADHGGLFWHYEAINRSWTDNLHLYLMARLSWNPEADVDELLGEYYGLFYGPAFMAMARFNDRLERNTATYEHDRHGIEAVPALWTPELIADCQADLEEAASVASVDEVWKQRVELAQANFDLSLKSLEVEQAKVRLAADESRANRRALLEAQERLATFHESLAPLKLTHRELFYYIAQDARPPAEYKVLATLPEYWRFAQDKEDEGERRGWYAEGFDDGDWESLSTRLFWEMQGYPGYNGHACYRIEFEAPTDTPGPLFLYFGAVDDHAWVYVNGKLAGSHAIGSLGWDRPFAIPVDGLWRPGEKNVIAVRVWDMEGAGGMFKPVWLVQESGAATETDGNKP